MDTCPTCASPLAPDQRYCVRCGTRRPDARITFLDVLEEDRALPPATLAPAFALPPAAPAAGLRGRVEANGPWIGLGAILVGVLLAGLLLGHWASGPGAAPAAASSPAPQVIRLEGGAAAPAAAATTTATAAAADDASGAAAAKDRASGADGTGATATTAKPPKDAVDVKKLTDKKALEKAIKKGKPISTGTGKLPPKDNKAAGGGSSFEEIG